MKLKKITCTRIYVTIYQQYYQRQGTSLQPNINPPLRMCFQALVLHHINPILYNGTRSLTKFSLFIFTTFSLHFFCLLFHRIFLASAQKSARRKVSRFMSLGEKGRSSIRKAFALRTQCRRSHSASRRGCSNGFSHASCALLSFFPGVHKEQRGIGA